MRRILISLSVAAIACSSATASARPERAAAGTRHLPTDRQAMLTEGQGLLARAGTVSQNYVAAPGRPSKAELDAAISETKSNLGALSATNPMDSLQMQMAIERLTASSSTLSALLKAYSGAVETIVENIK